MNFRFKRSVEVFSGAASKVHHSSRQTFDMYRPYTRVARIPSHSANRVEDFGLGITLDVNNIEEAGWLASRHAIMRN